MRLDAQQVAQRIARVKAIGRSAVRPIEDEIDATLQEFRDSGTTFRLSGPPRPQKPFPSFVRVLSLEPWAINVRAFEIALGSSRIT